MDITVPPSVASAAIVIASAPGIDTDIPIYIKVNALHFRATKSGLQPGGWVIERIVSFEQECPEAAVRVVPRSHLANVPSFIHDSAYVVINPLDGHIIDAGNDMRSMVATALVGLAFARPFNGKDGDRWNLAYIDLTMPVIADYVIQNPRTHSNPGGNFNVVRRSDYDKLINEDGIASGVAIPALYCTNTFGKALSARNSVNAMAPFGDDA